MSKKRRQFTPAFKSKVAMSAAKGDKTLAELASQYGGLPEPDLGLEEAAGGPDRGAVSRWATAAA